MAYSLDLRKKVLDQRKTHTLEETHSAFNISISTILDWEILQKETGSPKKRPLNRSFKKIDPIALAEFIIEFPDSYLHEMAEHFNCTTTAVFYALENQKITFKKLKFDIVKRMRKNAKLSKKIWRNQGQNIQRNRCSTLMKQGLTSTFIDLTLGQKEELRFLAKLEAKSFSVCLLWQAKAKIELLHLWFLAGRLTVSCLSIGLNTVFALR